MTEPRWSKRLVLDIETSPNVAHVWSLWQQNVGLSQLIEPSRMLCWAAQWYGDKRIMYSDIREGRSTMLDELRSVMDQADTIVTYNGKRFDIPRIATEFILEGMDQPSPFNQVDLYRFVRNRFSFPSHKLGYVAPALGVGEKVSHSGHELWVRCMEGDEAAWRMMKRYSKGDIKVTAALYEKLLPHIDTHPPVLLYQDDACNRCGGTDWTDGTKPYATAAGSLYPQLRCVGCGGWGRPVKREYGPTVRGVA